MKQVLLRMILAIIIQNCLIAETYASDNPITQNKSENKQSKAITFNDPNDPPLHTDNTVEWYYNALNQDLSIFSEEETIDVIKKSMRSWSDISGLQFIYKGTTTNNINNTNDGIITIGFWSNEAYTNFRGDTGGYAWIEWRMFTVTDGYMLLNAGDNSDGRNIPTNLTQLQGLITHELGHLLAINHSDDKDSIMFADPYHSYEYQAILRDDDIKIASQLYPLDASDSLTVVRKNLDIIIQSAAFNAASNGSSNIWAVLDFNGTDSNGDITWKLKTYGFNDEITSNNNNPLTTVRPNLDIIIESATLYSASGETFDVWAILNFKGTDANNDIIWTLGTYGFNE